MNVYVDSSVAGRIIFQQANPLPDWGRWDLAGSSEIMGVEMRRAIHRLRLERIPDDAWLISALDALREVEDALQQFPLDRQVLFLASMPLTSPVRTLDAIHLASALRYRTAVGGPILFATHDRQQALAARALGFEVIGA